MSDRITYLIAGILLLIMFLMAFFSIANDSLTFDELAHIPAGYSYLTQKDYRINPEHPPLAKDIAAVPLLFLPLNFPSEHPTWTQENSAPPWWIQFDLGREFLYRSDNNPKTIIFWSRLPMIFLLILLGWFLFKWARELGGNYLSLGVLALFSFSPTFIAHGRLVATDVAVALGAVLSTYFWLKFLKNPSKINIFWAGITFGVAMVLKFSLILLIPFFGIITIAYALVFRKPTETKLKSLKKYIFSSFLIGLIGLLFIIWPIYQFHVFNYPPDHQLRDTIADLAPNQLTPVKNLTIWMADKPFLRPLAQYFRGILMASQRTLFGNTVYFLGNISADGWWYYFPIIYFLKIPLAFHLLTIISLFGTAFLLLKKKLQTSLKAFVKNHFTLFSFFIFLFIYWAAAMAGNLNIGIRHLLPTFPFIYLLVVFGLKTILSSLPSFSLKNWARGIIILLFVWYIGSSLVVFPYYLSYFNESVGGVKNGYKYAVDSNYDWGQDFYRLLDFVEKNNITKLHLDYFGGEDPEYWLGEKYIKLEPRETKEPPKGWVAVSLNQLQGGIAKAVPDFDQPTGYYRWLAEYTPVARIGYSMFVYYIK